MLKVLSLSIIGYQTATAGYSIITAQIKYYSNGAQQGKISSMFTQFSEVQSHIEDHKVQMIDLTFSDLWGRWHHVTLPVSSFKEDLLTKGVGFDGSSVGLKSVHTGEMVLVPDVETGFIDPF